MESEHCGGTGQETVVTTVLWLFPGFGSVTEEEETEAELRIGVLQARLVDVVKAIVKVRERFGASGISRRQRIFAPDWAHSELLKNASKVRPAGMGSVATTLGALSGPL